MGLVWDLDNSAIERDEKYVLLAYVDHSDHEGKNIYPAVSTIVEKTGYSERSVQTITKSLAKKGYLVADGKGPKGTNKWRYGGGAISAGVQNPDHGGAKPKREGVQPAAPDPSLTTILEPSVKEGATPTPPEIKLYRDVSKKFPNSVNFENVVEAIRKVSARLGREAIAEDIRPFYQEWTARGYNQFSIKWLLDWAVTGIIPAPIQKEKPSVPRGVSVAQSWLMKKQQEQNG